MTTQGHIIVGTAGHIDHGKTSLVRILTGIDTDRLKEEKERGITIELGFAPLTLPSGLRMGLVDVPGHERFVKNMVAGATGIDLVLLVIAADEGVMPQTREHLDICQLLGVRGGLVALTKTDMVDREWVEMVSEEIREYMSSTFLGNAPIIPFSSVTGEGREDLLEALEKMAADIPPRSGAGIFRLPVDRVFTMKGFGTVVTGTLISGTVSAGEEVTFLPGDKSGRLRGIQVHGELVETSSAGTRTALNIQGLDRDEIHRGQTAVRTGSMKPSLMLDVRMSLLPSAPRPLKNRDRLRFHLYTREVMARAIILDGEQLEPGQEGTVQLRLEGPVVALPGDRFVVRSYSPMTTIGGGGILDPLPGKHRRNRPPVLDQLVRLRSEDPSERIMALLDEASDIGLPALELGIRTGLGTSMAVKLLDELAGKGTVVVSRIGDNVLAYSTEAFEKIRSRLIRSVEKFHQANPARSGIGREELRMRVAKQLPDRPYRNLLAALAQQGEIVLEGDTVSLGSHEASLTPQQETVAARVSNVLKPKGLSSPFVAELAEELRTPAAELKTVLNLMADRGDLVRIKDDYFITKAAHESLVEDLEAYFQTKKEMALPDFRQIVNTTRKWMIPLLEYLDRIQFTLRKGDVRIRRGQRPVGG